MQNRPVVQSITVHPLRPRFNSSPVRFVPATAFKALSSFSSSLLFLHASTCLRECVLSKRERERERLKVRVSRSFTQRGVLFELLHFDYLNRARAKRMQPLRCQDAIEYLGFWRSESKLRALFVSSCVQRLRPY